jgi:hypothetical protein
LFRCREYVAKEWCGLGRDLLKHKMRDTLRFLRLDNADSRPVLD